jgi:hypothetical protein
VSDDPAFPPPPPPSLAPPPGQVGYQASAFGAVNLRRVSGLALALTITTSIAGAGSLLNLAVIPNQVGNAEDFLRGVITEDEFKDSQVTTGLVGFLIAAGTLATVVLTMIWLFRVASNHRALGRETAFAPGFGIGGWFLPPLLYVVPTLMLRENWKAAEPSSPPGDDGWRRSAEPWLVWVWFLVYSVVPLALVVAGQSIGFGAGFGADQEEIAEGIVDNETGLYVTAVSTVVAAVLWVLVVRGLTARHVRFSGESVAR